MNRSKNVNIGTSGWHYDHWHGPFYPEDLPSSEALSFYLERFSTVEINNSFYQLPEEETLETWRNTVPDDFIFAVKASRYITHMKKLKDPQEPVSNFMSLVSTLEDKLGPILFQLPGSWHFNEERLTHFLSVLPDGFRYVFEFRDPDWHNEACYELLAKHNAAFCIFEIDHFLSPRQVTADFVYIRLHGPGAAYEGQYSSQTLAGWAGAFNSWLQQGHQIYCYFDNDQNGYAPQDAAQLQAMLED
jgi:uncharacterized protein YecE (DUF72 family)